MPVGLDKVFGVHAHAMTLQARRAEILASNLSNVDTPNYKARDFDFKSALKAANTNSPAALTTTHKNHISTTTGTEASIAGAGLKFRIPNNPSLDGNTVDSQLEQSEFTNNAVRYQTSLKFLGGNIKGILRALQRE